MPSELLKEVALPLALFAVLFGMGLSLVPADFRRVILSPKAKIVGLTCQLVLLPLVAFTLALAFRLPGELAVGLMVLAACPGGPTSNVITHLAKGDTALSVTLTAISSMVCVFTIPWIVAFSMDWFLGSGAAVQLPFWKTLGQLTLVTIVPIVCGMAVRSARVCENLFNLILFKPKTSITACVSPGESGSFNSSKPTTLPFTSLSLIASKQIFVGL